MEYIQMDCGVFPIRGGTTKGENDRRGMMTRIYASEAALREGRHDYDFFYCDNDTAVYHALLAMAGYVFSAETLGKAYREGGFPCGFCGSYNGNDRTRYLIKGKNPYLGNCNYGLGHIYPVGQCYPKPYITTKQILDNFFRVGKSPDWPQRGIQILVKAKAEKIWVRQMVMQEPEKAKKYRDALLFRLLHPCNYFFAPGLGNQRASIRENTFLIHEVWETYRSKYPGIYEEFERVALYRHPYVILEEPG